MKRVFGRVEVIFNLSYMVVASLLGFILLGTSQENIGRMLAGIMALVLVVGDAFHLVPRIMLIRGGNEEDLRAKLGRGKQVTSITMTLFYLLVWQLGVLLYKPSSITIWSLGLYVLACIRIVLCLMPHNRWEEKESPLAWGIWRNIPFFLMGILVATFFFIYREVVPALGLLWFAILLSFAFYLPVVLWVQKNPKIGMLMLPKTCSYIWMLGMCLSL